MKIEGLNEGNMGKDYDKIQKSQNIRKTQILYIIDY
jgi:hypothetical protein